MSLFEGGNLWLQQYWQFFGMTSEASLGSTVHCKSGRAKGGLWQVQTWCWINHVWTLNYVFVCQQMGLVDWWHTSQVHRAPYLYVLPVVFKLLLSMRLTLVWMFSSDLDLCRQIPNQCLLLQFSGTCRICLDAKGSGIHMQSWWVCWTQLICWYVQVLTHSISSGLSFKLYVFTFFGVWCLGYLVNFLFEKQSTLTSSKVVMQG